MHWQCYYCGSYVPVETRLCPTCGHQKSRLIYVHLLGIIGGLFGSLAGFTAYAIAGALAGGLLGILLFEGAARLALRPRKGSP